MKKKRKGYVPGLRSPKYLKILELDHFTLLFADDGYKCTKIYNARAQLLFCSLNLLFGHVLVAVNVYVGDGRIN